jgi:phospholipid/cholesterol/gamma-HCH transport system substrate-binding protein
MLSRVNARGLAVAAAVVLLAATFFVFRSANADTRTVSAHFPRAVSIYKGSDVRILGVNVGKVTDVVPEGNSVRVEMEYSGEYDLPADAKAVIVTPTLVADRFVQLTPVYESGPKMKDNGDIPLDATGVPIELDRIYASLQDLSQALGPNGVNKDGTLNHLFAVAEKNLRGKGALGNKMINDLSEAAETFGQGSSDLFATVRNLASFTQVLARNDQLVRAFIQDLSGVSADLAGERVELQQALGEVAKAVGTVQAFVKDNRKALSDDLKDLSRVARTMASERDSINKALIAGPIGISNLNLAFDVATGSIGSRIGVQGNIADADGFLCAVVQQTTLPKASKNLACKLFEQILEPVGTGVAEKMSGGNGSTRELTAAQVNARYSSDQSTSLADLTGGR